MIITWRHALFYKPLTIIIHDWNSISLHGLSLEAHLVLAEVTIKSKFKCNLLKFKFKLGLNITPKVLHQQA